MSAVPTREPIDEDVEQANSFMRAAESERECALLCLVPECQTQHRENANKFEGVARWLLRLPQ